MTISPDHEGRRLPGEDLVTQGVADLRAERHSSQAMLVALARERLVRLGLDVPEVAVESPAHELYVMLSSEDPATAHSRYNALRRQVVSYARAADHASAGG